MKERFFVKYTQQEIGLVTDLLRQLGFKRWRFYAAMIWRDHSEGIIADEDGDYFVCAYEQTEQAPIKTIDDLRDMVAELKSEKL